MNYLTKRHKHIWSTHFKMIFKSAIELKSRMDNADYYIHNYEMAAIEKRLARVQIKNEEV